MSIRTKRLKKSIRNVHYTKINYFSSDFFRKAALKSGFRYQQSMEQCVSSDCVSI